MSSAKAGTTLPQSAFAPLSPDGPLPPGLTGKIIATAYRSMRADLKPKKLLRLLGHRAPTTPSSDLLHRSLRKAFDDPRTKTRRARPALSSSRSHLLMAS